MSNLQESSLFGIDNSVEDNNPYTKKIVVPQYIPSNDKPQIEKLIDDRKYNALITNINNSNVSEEEKRFLKKVKLLMVPKEVKPLLKVRLFQVDLESLQAVVTPNTIHQVVVQTAKKVVVVQKAKVLLANQVNPLLLITPLPGQISGSKDSKKTSTI